MKRIIAISLFICAIVANLSVDKNENTIWGFCVTTFESLAGAVGAVVPNLTCYCALMSD